MNWIIRIPILARLTSSHRLATLEPAKENVMRTLVRNFTVAIVAMAAMGATIARVGEEAPAFRTVDLQGKQVSLAALKGNVVVLHFATSW